MAGDWIKMRTDLYRDPKVCMIADYLMDPDGELASYVSQVCRATMSVTRNVTRNVTVGALVTLWGVTRHRGKRDGNDLVLRGAAASLCDDIADLPGLGAAMVAVGWAIETEQGLVFPNFFEEMNEDPNIDAKKKAAERQKRYRQKRDALRDVTVTSKSDVREEKRREENIKKETESGIVSTFLSDPKFASVWSDWKQMVLEKHFVEIRGMQAQTILSDLERHSIEDACEMLRYSTLVGAKNPITNGDHKGHARGSPGRRGKALGPEIAF